MQQIENFSTTFQSSPLITESIPETLQYTDLHVKPISTLENDYELNSGQLKSMLSIKSEQNTAATTSSTITSQEPIDPSHTELITTCLDILSDIIQLESTINFRHKQHSASELISTLYQVVKHLNRQFHMLREILVLPECSMDISYVSEKYADLQQLALTVHTKQQICWPVLSSNLNFISSNILQVLHQTVHLLAAKKTGFNPRNKSSKFYSYKPNELSILINKIKTVSEYLPMAAAFDQTDILALSNDHPTHQDLLQAIDYKSLGTPKQIKASYTKFLRGYQGGINFLSQSYSAKNMFSKYMLTVTKAVYYTVLKERARTDANLFFSQPDEQTAIKAWNEIDKLSALINKPILKSVKHARRIHVPRLHKPLTLQMINKALENGTLNSIAPLPEGGNSLVEGINPYDITTKGNSNEKVHILVLSNGHLHSKQHIQTMVKLNRVENNIAVDLQTENTDNIPLNISPTKLNTISFPKPHSMCNKFLRSICKSLTIPTRSSKNPKLNTFNDELIIHIHGGGFVAMSADTHQSYSRQWVHQLNRPVLSIDYRLAPQSQYPDALDDCWQAYNWIVSHAETALGIKPSKIILAGDSAGANLALGVCVLAIKNGVKRPDGLFLAYPALNLDQNNYTPSIIQSVEDELLPYTLLKMCVRMYVPEGGDVKRDPLLSPEGLSEEILKEMPMIRMMVGEDDAFKDGCRRMVGRLRKVEKEVKMRVYEGMGHGFLGFDMAMGMEVAKVCVRDAGEMMREIFESAKEGIIKNV